MKLSWNGLALLVLAACTKHNDYLYPRHPLYVEPAPSCELTVSPGVTTQDRALVVTMTTLGKVASATLDGKSVSFPKATSTIIQATPGKFASLGAVKGPGGEAKCEVKYDVLERRYQRFEKQIKDLQILTDIDIIWVIDNSGSMLEFQQAVVANTDIFMQQYTQIHGLKWKMGLLSTDERQAPFIGFTPATLLSFQSTDPVGLFRAAVGGLTTLGAGREETFTPLVNALNHFPDFMRPSAALATIFVTDAPEQSWPLAQEVLDVIKQKKGSLDKVYGYGVLGALDLGCTTVEGKWNYSGSEYEKYIAGTHGTAYPLCKAFAQNLLEIAKKIVSTSVLTNKIPLPSRPYPESIAVTFRGNLIPSGPSPTGYWTYDAGANAAVFHDLSFAPGAQEFVEIRYEEDYL